MNRGSGRGNRGGRGGARGRGAGSSRGGFGGSGGGFGGASRGGRGAPRGGQGGASRGGRGAPRGGSAGRGRGGGFRAPSMLGGSMLGRLWRYENFTQEFESFFIPSDFLIPLKKRVVATCQESKECVPIAQEQARYIWITRARNSDFAQTHCVKQPESIRAGKGYSCGNCDIYTDTHTELLEHNKSTPHKEILGLFRKFDPLFKEWLKQFNDPSYALSEGATDAQVNGIKIEKSDMQRTANMTPINELLFKDLDHTTLNDEEYVLAAYDVIMEVHWPKPVTDHYCRECNYRSFLSEKELEMHQTSPEHKNFAANYSISWCVSCQFHLGTKEGLEGHQNSPRHTMIVKMLEDVRTKAIEMYNRKRNGDKRKQELEEKKQAEQKNKFNNKRGMLHAGIKREAEYPMPYGMPPRPPTPLGYGGHFASGREMYGGPRPGGAFRGGFRPPPPRGLFQMF
ncbi:uncharacterized protein [Clytia hemisphaerica]|uniref:Uncharacterized protein n=1 Tax=Clytia hemisphaerica TaxID=252671 RepID=A0A7M5V3R8_9CNID